MTAAPILHPTTRVRIEQAIARGLDDDQIARHVHVPTAVVLDVRLDLDEINGQPDGQIHDRRFAHGTHSGYQRHREHRERACVPCKAAEAAYRQQRRGTA